MNKTWLSYTMKNIRYSLRRYSPEILTGMGITGMITTTIMAVKATPKALKLLDEEVQYRIQNNYRDDDKNIDGLIKVTGDENSDLEYYKLPIKDVIKATWLCYIPAAITGTVSIICLIGASSVNFRRNAALATAYTISETALKEYQEKVIETIGEKKERSIKDAIAKDRIEKNPVNESQVIVTNKGETLCYDMLSGRYFKSDIDKIKKIINELNHRLLTEMYISLNDLYYELGLDTVKLGDELGWNVDKGLIDVHFSSQLANGERPSLVLDFKIPPQYDYQR